MSDAQSATPKEARDLVVAGFKRTLYGPQTNLDQAWLGASRQPTLVNAAFKDSNSFPIGPWIGEHGEEVLSRAPAYTYGIGVLFPAMNNQQIGELESGQADVVRECEAAVSDEDEEKVIEVLDPELIELEPVSEADDDNDQVNESPTRPRSLAVSVRIPVSVSEITVEFRGGVYQPIAINGQNRPWWRRIDVSFSKAFAISADVKHEYTFGALKLTVGITFRPYDDGSRICTIWIRNDSEVTGDNGASEFCVFQAELAAECGSLLAYLPIGERNIDSLDLLYREAPLLAVGHGCDVSVERVNDKYRITTQTLPVVHVPSLTPDIMFAGGVPYAVGMQDLADMLPEAIQGIERLLDGYRKWIDQQAELVSGLESEYQSTARRHIQQCSEFYENFLTGWRLVQNDNEIQLCLRHMSQAMNTQRVAYSADTRAVKYSSKLKAWQIDGKIPHDLERSQERWRPFQIAFILASLPKIVDKNHEGRSTVDVIWMPTGGGKTEAYLGLAAFAILWDRRQQSLGNALSQTGGNTKVFMRYTLRLLTVQQMSRAASLICALEIAREADPVRYGAGEVRIGAWLGAKMSANHRAEACRRVRDASKRPTDPAGFLLSRCPWCAAQMGHVENGVVVGYHIVGVPGPRRVERVLAACPDPKCLFTKRTISGQNGQRLDRGIPVLEVDEDLYQYPPDFVVGTIDKVARMAWKPESQAFFGLRSGVRKASPPSLFIQDELHLIAGPLGSIDGAFEAMLEYLCQFDGGSAPVIVASTATTKNYINQIKNLYNREGRVVPPPGLTIDDSFFAVRDNDAPGKIYVGVSASGFVRAVDTQGRVLAALAHHGPMLQKVSADPDPWWTNLVFFSSRRALGLLNSAVETSLYPLLRRIRQISGIRSGKIFDDKEAATRNMGRVRELTATSSEDVSKVLDELSLRQGSDHSIDLCFATSMVEVGLDVQRLGLMTVIGQPKSASQYIQVTGRVGRSNSSPGLIVTVLNPGTVRDRSHYEGFTAWHNRLYASVESVSVTPFTSRALERSCPSVMATLIRMLASGAGVVEQSVEFWDRASAVLVSRIDPSDQRAQTNLSRQLQYLYTLVTAPDALNYVWDKWDGSEKPLMYGAGEPLPVERAGTPYWSVMNSMRSVEADTMMRVASFDVAGAREVEIAESPIDEGEM